ncbi:MAG: aminomethyl-transferring glycine dehydrogenase subunit GcvPA [Candidatus Krumholzibacteriota bacterium]|nr:aminomethyl-transferring glycine dehydrogenase subunit GcvPA [Candidatus Krumholzibacteriota bacterium]
MPYTYHTDEDRRIMLEFIGLTSEDELFDVIPENLRVDGYLPIDAGMSEPQALRYFENLAEKNHNAASLVSFLGGGVYDHVIPSVVGNLASRPEFATAYTPYQPEASQGTLQVIFEFQTHISRLTGLPVANASMYDAASGLAEASLMAAKIRSRDTILYPESLNPRYVRVLRRYLEGQSIGLRPIPHTATGQIDEDVLEAALDDSVAGVIVQTPNYFGVVERPWRFEGAVHDAGALLIAAVDPISLSLLRPPGSWGADITVGEGQSLGNPMSFGGPLLGFMACRKEYIRRMPGRIVSAAKDRDGRDAFVLALQTREQHIRREKATSNICTNQGLLATRATIYLSLLGETGFTELGRVCHAGARHLADMIEACDGYNLRYSGPFFREFVVECPSPAREVIAACRARGILAGVPLERYYGDVAHNALLMAVTEKHTNQDFERLGDVLRDVARSMR